ncbi:MAG: hypothetical protein QM733_24825 [Ilumatobacteraceae bacterium]
MISSSSFFVTTAWIIIAWFNYRLKKKIIESGPVSQDSVNLFRNNIAGPGFEALKWGCVSFFGGMGLVLIQFLPHDNDSPLPYGLVAMFGGLGFLVYWFIVDKKK